MRDDGLYDRDIYAWAETQAGVLRRLAETGRDLPNELDLENIVEEIEGVARTELHRAESFLRLLLIHLLKLASAPRSNAAGHWRAEISAFHAEFIDSLSPTIARKIDLARRWRLAIDQARAQLELEGDVLAPHVPALCPFKIAELTADPFDIHEAIRRLMEPDGVSATAEE